MHNTKQQMDTAGEELVDHLATKEQARKEAGLFPLNCMMTFNVKHLRRKCEDSLTAA